jgi:hypothetical protein
MRNAACGANDASLNSRRAAELISSLIISSANQLQASSIVTAIPGGEWWRVKVISASGDVQLLGKFDGRLAALIAAVLLAEHLGARVVP